ncbi:MAG: penicillin-insensitive murein endopeptidase [Myxococcota bacterium]
MQRGAMGVLGLVGSLLPLATARASPAEHPPHTKDPEGSIGYYSHGSLDGGVALPEESADHYLVFPARCYATPAFAAEYPEPSRRENFWGNAATVEAILEVTAAVRRAHPDMPRIAVAEIGNRSGGPIPYHLSHQNGLDVDILFPQRGDGPRFPVAPCTPYGEHRRFEGIDPASGKWAVSADFELAWNWALASAFAARKDVQAIFIGALIEKSLSDWATREGIPAAERRLTLAKLMAVTCAPPKGVKVPFYKNNFCPHDDHIHVRFKCPKDSKRCVSHR